MPLAVVNRTKSNPPAALFFGLFARTRRHFPILNKKQVALVFIKPSESLRLNSRYRRKQTPTNVLSFAASHTPADGELGDILLCPAVAREEAKASGVEPDEWLGRLFVHGLLHLLEFSHATKKEEKRMEKYAQRIINREHAQSLKKI